MSEASARSSKQRKKNNCRCSVPGCGSARTESISLHFFPRSKHLRDEWIYALSFPKTVTNSMCVCSLHFKREDYFFPDLEVKRRRLKRTAVPSLNLPKLDERGETSKDGTRKPHKTWRQTKHFIPENAGQKESESETKKFLSEELAQTCCSSCSNRLQEESSQVVRARPGQEASTALVELFDKAKGVRIHQTNNNEEQEEEKIVPDITPENEEESNAPSAKVTLPQSIQTVVDLYTLTGISYIPFLDGLVKMAQEVSGEMIEDSCPVSLKNRVMLTLSKIRLNLSFECLSTLFQISPQECSTYFRTTIQQLAVVLSETFMWPSKGQISKNLPICFHRLAQLRIILSMFEVPIQESDCLNCRVSTYSRTAGTHVVKALVGHTPSGFISHFSSFYGGKATDRAIILHSGVLDQCDSGDVVMVDRSFPIENECTERGLHLVQVPWIHVKERSDSPFTMETTVTTRLHVRKCIQKLKQFKILSERLPLTLVPFVDDILQTVIGVINMQSTMLAPQRFNLSKDSDPGNPQKIVSIFVCKKT